MSLDLFLNHRPDEVGLLKIEKIKLKASEFYSSIVDLCPMGEEKEEAKRQIRAAAMWAVNAIVQQYPSIPLGERYPEQLHGTTNR